MRMCRSCCGCTCTLSGITNYTGCAAPATISLSGIASPGGGTITITATSSDTTLIPGIVVHYTSPNSTGTLDLTWGLGTGSAVISVTASSTACAPVTKTFSATPITTTGPPRFNPPTNDTLVLNGPGKTQTITGINIGLNPLGSATTMALSAVSSNPGIVPNPAVSYTSPNATGTLTYTPVPTATGTVTIIVTVTTNGPVGGCNTNQFSQNFTVVVS